MFIRNMLPSRSDFLASLVVFIIAVPLSLGIALASGTSPASGLIAAIIGGLIVGTASGVPFMVSGPAAGLTVLVFQIVQEYGLAGLALATAAAGIIQLVLGFLKLGWVFKLVPTGILNGMLSAIGFIILVGQLHILAGAAVPASPIKGVLTLPESFMQTFASGPWAPVFWIGLFAIAVQVFWPKSWKDKINLPPALPAVFFGTLFSLGFQMKRVEIGSLGNSVSDTFASISSFQMDSITIGIIISALGLALVASAESLLTARAIDVLMPDHPSSDLDRELKAQGLGNMASGFLGGLPITGVIVRSAANVQAGAETRKSAVYHGLWILLFLTLFTAILQSIPLTVLASVLIVTGIKLLNIPQLITSLKTETQQGLYWLITMVAIISTDLLMGLGIGMMIVALVAVYQRVAVGKTNSTGNEAA